MFTVLSHGLRVSELTSLKLTDLDIKERKGPFTRSAIWKIFSKLSKKVGDEDVTALVYTIPKDPEELEDAIEKL